MKQFTQNFNSKIFLAEYFKKQLNFQDFFPSSYSRTMKKSFSTGLKKQNCSFLISGHTEHWGDSRVQVSVRDLQFLTAEILTGNLVELKAQLWLIIDENLLKPCTLMCALFKSLIHRKIPWLGTTNRAVSNEIQFSYNTTVLAIFL